MNLLLILEKIQSITKYDKTKLITYLGISLFIFFFLEKVEFRKIALIVIVFIGVFYYYNSNEIKEELITSNPLSSHSGKDISINDKSVNKNIQKTKITNPELAQKVDLDKLDNQLKAIKQFIKVNVREIIKNVGNSPFKNKNLGIYNNLVVLMNDYLHQVKFVLEGRDFKHKNLEKVRDIKTEINVVIHSIHFKVNANRDKDITQLANKLNETFKEIDDYLVSHVNKRFYEAPTYLSGVVNCEENAPRAFDINTDIDSHLVDF
jgi:hypothetical protein